MPPPVVRLPTSHLQHEIKRHDTGLGLSESPPPAETPLQTQPQPQPQPQQHQPQPQQHQHQQHQHQQQVTTRTRMHSTSTQSSTPSDDTSLSSRPRFHQGLLMPDATPDLQHEARHASYRRRVRKEVFGKDTHLDWKSAPVVCDEHYDYASLLYRRELRCDASRQYLRDIRDDLKPHAVQRACWKTLASSDDVVQVVCIDGEEMIDMVG